MFDFSMGELGLIFTVGLLVLGPKKLAEVAKMLGKGLGSLKKTMDEVKEVVQSELDDIKDASGIKEALNEGTTIKKSLQDMTEQVKKDVKSAADLSGIEQSVNDSAKNVAEAAEAKRQTEKDIE